MARPWTEGKGIGTLPGMKQRRPAHQRDVLIFIIISVILMVIVDQVIFGGERSYQAKIREEYYKEHPEARPPAVPETAPVEESETPPPAAPPQTEEEHGALQLPDPEPDYRDLPPPEPILPIHDETFGPPPAKVEQAVAPAAPETAAPTPAVLPPVAAPGKIGRGKIAIIIDDVGMNLTNSNAVIGLPAPITLAFLPYAPKAAALANKAKEAGHELMIHTPMEATGSNSGLGPMALKSSMDNAAIKTELDKMFASFTGYRGINNHMGSKLTQDAAKMDVVMTALKSRGLYFVDSKTIGNSVAAARARAAGLPYAERDIFLDHEETGAFVSAALRHAERLAESKGYAILIGHPKDVTIAGLRAWIPTLKDKGLELVPVSAVLTRPADVAKTPAPSTPPPAVIQPAAVSAAAPVPQPAPQP